ncbi:YciI family protein [Aquabacterium sp.]|uniref:YciI family protein n=1 Tax=Aquabacterium sp. TaxID=1872578 RepID=UPI00378470F6
MSYALLMIEPIEQRRERGLEAGQQVYQRMLDFAAELQARGVLQATQSLAGHGDAKRLQVRNGQRSVVDGPFAETKEMVGGFFLLKDVTEAEALEIAAACPAAEWCTVEIRALGPCFERP